MIKYKYTIYYDGKDGRRFETGVINDAMNRDHALEMVTRHANEYPNPLIAKFESFQEPDPFYAIAKPLLGDVEHTGKRFEHSFEPDEEILFDERNNPYREWATVREIRESKSDFLIARMELAITVARLKRELKKHAEATLKPVVEWLDKAITKAKSLCKKSLGALIATNRSRDRE